MWPICGKIGASIIGKILHHLQFNPLLSSCVKVYKKLLGEIIEETRDD